jgi:hypothetical protein
MLLAFIQRSASGFVDRHRGPLSPTTDRRQLPPTRNDLSRSSCHSTLLALAILALLALPGCAGTRVAPTVTAAHAEATLTARVETYWAARQNSDLAAAYESYSPEFRSTTPRSLFLKNYQRLVRFPPDRVVIESISLDESKREAAVTIRLILTRDIEGKPVVFDGVTEERWIYMDGTWWKKSEPLRINI